MTYLPHTFAVVLVIVSLAVLASSPTFFPA